MDKTAAKPAEPAPDSKSVHAARARWRDLTKEIQASRYPNSRPRDAATLLVLDSSAGEPRLLMGQRHHKLKFMPGKFVFPGGRVEPQDYLATAGCSLPAPIVARLLRGIDRPAHPQRAYALAHAALRETQEETGIVIGAGAKAPESDAELVPDFTGLSFLARAITPPRRLRRFDTRFFIVAADSITERKPITDGEFVAVEWFSLSEARKQDLPGITRIILDDLEARIDAGTVCDPEVSVPFYFMRGACFHRKLL